MPLFTPIIKKKPKHMFRFFSKMRKIKNKQKFKINEQFSWQNDKNNPLCLQIYKQFYVAYQDDWHQLDQNIIM